MKILVVEDDATVASMLRATLEREGYAVDVASDGKAALRCIDEAPVDLTIADILLPEKDGLEMISDIRRVFPAVKIIAITGGGRVGAEHYLTLASRLGADRVFKKPVEREALLQAVRELTEPAAC